MPIIDINPRRDAELKVKFRAETKRQKLLNFDCTEDVRYRERTTVERVNPRLKDEFRGRLARMRSRQSNLMFGIVAPAADQIKF